MPTLRTRSPGLAAVLSFLSFSPLGQIYAGHLRRSLSLWLITGICVPAMTLGVWLTRYGRLALLWTFLMLLAIPTILAVDAYVLARRQSPRELKPYQRWWVYVVAFALFSLLGTFVSNFWRTHALEAFSIATNSMAPTILAGDRIVVNKLSRKFPQRHDVVVFYSEGPDSQLYVMRVIGLPGETISIKDEQVFVDDEPLDDPYAVFHGPLPKTLDIANIAPVSVPTNSFYVLGDNRRNTRDSRVLGPIPFADYYAKAHMIYWSRKRTGDPDNPTTFVSGPIRWRRSGIPIR